MTDSILKGATIFHHDIETPEKIKGFKNRHAVLEVTEENRCWKFVKDAMLDNCMIIHQRNIPFATDVYQLTQNPPLN